MRGIRDQNHQHPGMQKASPSIKTMIQAITASGERSPLFWWFVENNAEFKAGMAGQRIRWSVVAEQASAMGLTNRLGGMPTAKFAKTTWHRACKYVSSKQAEASSAIPRRPTFPVPRDGAIVPLPAVAVAEGAVEFSHREAAAPPPPAASAPMTISIAAEPAERGSDPETKGVLAVLTPAVPLAPAVTERRPEPQWTPEQTAMIEAEMAKAFGELAHVDRFHNLKG